MKIAVILPSRGLMFSETADELLQNLQNYDYDIFFAHGLPIPDCFETPIEEALTNPENFTHFWFVEDDQILPPYMLGRMLALDVPVATCDYPVSKDGQGVVFSNREKEVLCCGTGCTLIKREVFEQLKPPFFRTDIKWNVVNYGTFIRLTANFNNNKSLEGYGLHDVTFGMMLYREGIPISVVGKIGQRKLVALGKPGTNEGAHEIEEWTKIRPNVLYRRFKSYPKQPIGKLIEVMTRVGSLTVHPDKAKTLIKMGVATKMPIKSVVIDYNDVEF